MGVPKRTAKAQSEEGTARFLAVLDAHTKLLAFFFGLCFVAAALVLAICFPDPTQFQYTVFRIVLALAAAGVAGVIPGMIHLKAQPGTALLIHAGGALAVFVMVYLLAPAALTKERPFPPPPSPLPPEKPAVSQPLKISNVDAIENGVHILNLSPPEAVRFARVSNLGDASVHISLIGFPEKYFYTNFEHEKSLLQGHADKNMSVVLLPTFFESEQKEYFFEVQASAGGTAKIAIRIHDGWPEYIAQQHQKINAKDAQGASAVELYQTAREIITESGYKELALPLQEVVAGQLLEAAKQPEAAAIAYAKAKKENAGLAERFIENSSLNVKSTLMGISRKKSDSKKYSSNSNEDSGRIVRASSDAALNKPEAGSSDNAAPSKYEKNLEENSFLLDTTPVCLFEEARNERYVNNNDGTITDIETGLMWKRCSEGLSGVNCEYGEIEKYVWKDAVRFFEKNEYAGYADWRLPAIDELQTLVWCSCRKKREDDSRCNTGSKEPTINHQAFPNTLAWKYFANNPYSSDVGSAIYFDDGISISEIYFIDIGSVRLVRGGQ